MHDTGFPTLKISFKNQLINEMNLFHIKWIYFTKAMKAGLFLLTWVWVVDIASHLFYHFLAPKVVVWLLSCVLLHCDSMNYSTCQTPLFMGFPGILEWVAVSFCKRSSQPRDWTCVSCIGRQILYHWATSEAWERRVSSVQSLSSVQLFATPWIAAYQACLSITNSWSLLKVMSIASVMPSNSLILWHPLLLPSVFTSIRVFSNESVLHIRWPKYWRKG